MGWHAIAARRLTGRDTTPVLTLDLGLDRDHRRDREPVAAPGARDPALQAGDAFSIADLTAAALFYPVVRPANFPHRSVTQLPPDARKWLDDLAERPGGRWVADIDARRRHSPGPSA